jgi:type IV pilus assembly protein PilY1
MRRGGKAYYALDVTNPESPRLMWSIDDSGDFAELGYTFSNPRVGLVNTGSGATPVIMFGGGYDMNKDSRGGVGSDDSEGNAIYVVNAETGQLIWKATGGAGGASANEFQHPKFLDSVPSTLTTADTDGDGLTDRIYVGDSGGNVWRADLGGSDTGDWKLTLLASLGRHSAGSFDKSGDRRFFHRPDLVQTKDEFGIFDAVLIGSGDRADPLDGGGTASNYFYMIKDRNTGVGAGLDIAIDNMMLDDVTSNCMQDGSCNLEMKMGWKLRMETSGEKILATPLTMSGKVFFTSYMPQGGSKASACSPSEGSGRLYAVSLQSAESVINYDTSDDVPTDDDPDGDDPTSKNDRSVELNSAGIPAEVVTIPPNKILRPDLQVDTIDVATRWRTYWYVTEDTDL